MKIKIKGPILSILCNFISLALSQDRTFMLARQNFATYFYKNVTQPGSLIASPTSMDFALSALFFGSSQQSFMELMTGLHYPKHYSINSIQNNLMLLTKNLKKVGGLEIATKMYVNETLLPQPGYKATIIRVLNADIESISFTQNVDAAEKINNYISEKTHKMINDVVDADSIDSGTTMVLINCIYFKGEWLYAFNKSKTFHGNFFIDDTNTVPVDFMTIKTTLFYGNIPELDAVAVSLPYKKSNMTMLLILPGKSIDLLNVIENMSKVDWSTIDEKLIKREINVTMPKFNITFQSRMDGVLKNMGIKGIFDKSTASLDRILSSKSRSANIYVSSIIHKAVINVDEEGTVAAAVSVTTTRSLPKNYLFNHPFLFMLRAGSSILFIGQYTGNATKPTSSK